MSSSVGCASIDGDAALSAGLVASDRGAASARRCPIDSRDRRGFDCGGVACDAVSAASDCGVGRFAMTYLPVTRPALQRAANLRTQCTVDQLVNAGKRDARPFGPMIKLVSQL